jgi:hypothetical protein
MNASKARKRQLKKLITENMKKIVMMVTAAIMVAISAQAQKIQVVDDDGNGIPLVSVLTENGLFIGTTDMNGVLDNVNGASKVALTHVAFKPQLVSLASVQNGKITMESVDYGLDEVVVKPKPYLYVEYYFRAFSYIDDSLRVYTAGIIPVAHEIRNKYKGITHSVWTFGGAANKALAWNTMDLADRAEQGAKGNASPIEKAIYESERFKDYYKTSVEPDGENRWIVRNPEEVLGHIIHDDGLSITTLDGGRSQIYANKVNGEEKKAKRREETDYTYQYTEVFKLNEEGKVQNDGFVMELDHWEYNAKKGRRITILYLYATEKSYMDEAEFKARRKELNKGHAGDMSLDELAKYAQEHNIPALAPQQLDAIKALIKQTGNKNRINKH